MVSRSRKRKQTRLRCAWATEEEKAEVASTHELLSLHGAVLVGRAGGLVLPRFLFKGMEWG